METPKWPELWAREPGLRPPAGIHFHNGQWCLGDSQYQGMSWGPRVDELAAPLCRDAATRWLAENSEHVRIYGDAYFGFPTVGVLHDLMDDGPDAYGEKGGTLESALWLACKAVLDRRDAKPTR